MHNFRHGLYGENEHAAQRQNYASGALAQPLNHTPDHIYARAARVKALVIWQNSQWIFP